MEYMLGDVFDVLHDDGTPYTRDEIVEVINNGEGYYFDLSHEALETHLEYRGAVSYGRGGWAYNVKLHGVFDKLREWDSLLDLIDQSHMDDLYDWSHLVEIEYESWLDDLDPLLDRKKFSIRGRSGGWLIYEKGMLGLDEAEALKATYEALPEQLDWLCGMIATDMVAHGLAEQLGTTVDNVEQEEFTIDGITYSVTYKRKDK